MKVLYVEWVDASSISDWLKLTDTDIEVHECKSIGFLIKETKDSIALAAAIGLEKKERDTEANAIIVIPKAWIKKRKVVKL